MDNFTVDEPPSSLSYAFYIIHEIVFVVFVVLGIILDALLIYTVAKYDKVRTVSNIYLANWATADILCLLLTPSAYNIIAVLDKISGYFTFFTVIFKLAIIVHVTVNVCVVIIVFDWLITTYCPRYLDTVHYYYKLVLGSLWILALMISIISLATCKRYYYCYISEIELLVSYGVLALLVITVLIMQGIRKCRRLPPPDSTLRLTMASIFVLTWLFGFSNLIFLKWQFDHPLVSALLDCITFSTSFVNIALLYYYDMDFQTSLLQVLKRNKYTERLYSFKNPLVIDRNGTDVENSM